MSDIIDDFDKEFPDKICKKDNCSQLYEFEDKMLIQNETNIRRIFEEVLDKKMETSVNIQNRLNKIEDNLLMIKLGHKYTFSISLFVGWLALLLIITHIFH